MTRTTHARYKPNTTPISFVALALLLGLGGCAGLAGDWPSLTLPEEEITAAQATIEPLAPVNVPPPPASAVRPPLTALGLEALALEAQERLNLAKDQRALLDDSMLAVRNASASRQRWNAAQLALSRLSRMESDLQRLLERAHAPLTQEASDATARQQKAALIDSLSTEQAAVRAATGEARLRLAQLQPPPAAD